MSDAYTLVVFSHLRWDFVYQRPQHLLSRLAQRHPVLLIEEPVYQADAGPYPYWKLSSPVAGVTVAQLHTPVEAPGFHDDHLPTMVPLLRNLLAERGADNVVAWLYTPLALPLAQAIRSRAVVYDCMDELSAFLNAPPLLLEREAQLLDWADLVFTGGPSLYRSKRDRHPSVHCFPSSVDAAHFRQALGTIAEAADQAALPHPRLGFYGVIDERLDSELLASLAAAHPEWQIVMVGPVVKIDPATLPSQPNIHYLGQRSYHELPAYLAGWDVCLLPFARNQATQFISPTKTLEYMAAEKPIVSTPITDVAEPYGEIVLIGATPEEFIAACDCALHVSGAAREAMVAKMRSVLERTSWDATVQAIEGLIDQAVLNARAREVGA